MGIRSATSVTLASMPIKDQIAVGASRIHTILSGGYTHASVEGDTVMLAGPSSKGRLALPIESIVDIDIRRSLLRHRLVIRTSDGGQYLVGSLGRDEAVQLDCEIREAASRRQPEVSALVTELASRVDGLLDGTRYIRRSEADAFFVDFAEELNRCRGLVAQGLTPDIMAVLNRLTEVATPQAFAFERTQSNRQFIERSVPAVRKAALETSSSVLTDEQAMAVATDEDATLVLAGAGTGKTAVIVSKALYLVRDQGVPAGQVIILAFNRKAAEEVRERLPEDLSDTHVSTFHAFGRRVIAHSDVAPSISRMAADQYALVGAMDGIVNTLLRDPERAEAVMEYLAYWPAPYRSAFDFSSPEEYAQYVRGVELRALSGDLVRSFEELVIANYLTEHGVPFRYEQAYRVDTATKRHSQYRPDFYLPERDVYIEHFALDREGNPPPGWTGYADGVAWKRRIHEENRTRLIETYSWQQSEGTLRASLHATLEATGVKLERVDRAELVSRLGGRQVSTLARLLATFLTHTKGARLTNSELAARVRNSRDPKRAALFLAVYQHVREEYEELLAAERSIDFHDLINRAAELIEAGEWESPYRYVLVDEFQDISAGRMALLSALGRPGVAYFLVGDDWQSIYRFAGSDVQLMRDSHEHLGHVEARQLSRTFRFGRGILEPSSAFVQANPDQTRRTLVPAGTPEDRGITVVSHRSPAGALMAALNDIEELSADKPRSVLVLGRYHKSGGVMPARPVPGNGNLSVTFSTIHGAKGQEADYVVLLDLTDKRTGFPSRIEDDPLMDLVLPPIADKAFPVAEERRLFYVALTRARLGVYLATDAARPSEFVSELMKLHPDLRQLGPRPVTCARCSNGFLHVSKSGRNMTCSNRPYCTNVAPLCPGCNLGYTVVEEGRSRCLNPACNEPGEVCPRCALGVLVNRRGSSGPFWGCSAYLSEPPCRYTRPIRARRRWASRTRAG